MKIASFSLIFAGILFTGCEDDHSRDGRNYIVHVNNQTDAAITVYYSEEYYDYRFFFDHKQTTIPVGQTGGFSTYFTYANVPTKIEIEYRSDKKEFLIDNRETLTVTNNDF